MCRRWEEIQFSTYFLLSGESKRSINVNFSHPRKNELRKEKNYDKQINQKSSLSRFILQIKTKWKLPLLASWKKISFQESKDHKLLIGKDKTKFSKIGIPCTNSISNLKAANIWIAHTFYPNFNSELMHSTIQMSMTPQIEHSV